MDHRDIMRIEGEHHRTRIKLGTPRCPYCGESTVASIIQKECDYKDRWGGTVWGGKEDVPVWKCPNGHISHTVLME